MPRHVGAKSGFAASDALNVASAPLESPRANCWMPVLYAAFASPAAAVFFGAGASFAYGSIGPAGFFVSTGFTGVASGSHELFGAVFATGCGGGSFFCFGSAFLGSAFATTLGSAFLGSAFLGSGFLGSGFFGS